MDLKAQEHMGRQPFPAYKAAKGKSSTLAVFPFPADIIYDQASIEFDEACFIS
jgi:hypothetical protein